MSTSIVTKELQLSHTLSKRGAILFSQNNSGKLGFSQNVFIDDANGKISGVVETTTTTVITQVIDTRTIVTNTINFKSDSQFAARIYDSSIAYNQNNGYVLIASMFTGASPQQTRESGLTKWVPLESSVVKHSSTLRDRVVNLESCNLSRQWLPLGANILGDWDADTNTPTLKNESDLQMGDIEANVNDTYRVATPGAFFGGFSGESGEFIFYNGETWEKAYQRPLLLYTFKNTISNPSDTIFFDSSGNGIDSTVPTIPTAFSVKNESNTTLGGNHFPYMDDRLNFFQFNPDEEYVGPVVQGVQLTDNMLLSSLPYPFSVTCGFNIDQVNKFITETSLPLEGKKFPVFSIPSISLEVYCGFDTKISEPYYFEEHQYIEINGTKLYFDPPESANHHRFKQVNVLSQRMIILAFLNSTTIQVYTSPTKNILIPVTLPGVVDLRNTLLGCNILRNTSMNQNEVFSSDLLIPYYEKTREIYINEFSIYNQDLPSNDLIAEIFNIYLDSESGVITVADSIQNTDNNLNIINQYVANCKFLKTESFNINNSLWYLDKTLTVTGRIYYTRTNSSDLPYDSILTDSNLIVYVQGFFYASAEMQSADYVFLKIPFRNSQDSLDEFMFEPVTKPSPIDIYDQDPQGSTRGFGSIDINSPFGSARQIAVSQVAGQIIFTYDSNYSAVSGNAQHITNAVYFDTVNMQDGALVSFNFFYSPSTLMYPNHYYNPPPPPPPP